MHYGVVVLFLVIVCHSIVQSVRVSCPSGTVEGSISPLTNKVTRFLGIPFADLPERFEKAQLVTPWLGVRNATEFGPACSQPKIVPTINEQSEDCLLLDIYTPAPKSGENKAVMVFIHGGGFLVGASSLFESSHLSELGDVVVVVIQYRLNAFGFTYTNGVTPSNLGLWDQKLAMEWVYQNIDAFGGDASRITVFGESAGSISISIHMLSPQFSKNLFQKAILESGSYINGIKNNFIKNNTVIELAKEANCSQTLLNDTSQALKCLKTLNASELVNAAMPMTAVFNRFYFWPAVDNEYIVYEGIDVISKYQREGPEGIKPMFGESASIDTLMGFNGQEGLGMLAYLPSLQGRNLNEGVPTEEFYKAAKDNKLPLLSDDNSLVDKLSDKLAEYYNKDVKPTDKLTADQRRLIKLQELIADYELAVPTLLNSIYHSAVAPTDGSTNTYFYLFDHKLSIPNPSLSQLPSWLQTSATHADELHFLFDIDEGNGFIRSKFTEAEEQLSQEMMTYWTNFAKTGDPNTNTSSTQRQVENWTELSPNTQNYLRIIVDADKLEQKPNGDRYEFYQCLWRAVYEGEDNPDCFTKSANDFNPTTPNYASIVTLSGTIYTLTTFFNFLI